MARQSYCSRGSGGLRVSPHAAPVIAQAVVGSKERVVGPANIAAALIVGEDERMTQDDVLEVLPVLHPGGPQVPRHWNPFRTTEFQRPEIVLALAQRTVFHRDFLLIGRSSGPRKRASTWLNLDPRLR